MFVEIDKKFLGDFFGKKINARTFYGMTSSITQGSYGTITCKSKYFISYMYIHAVYIKCKLLVNN